MNTLRALVIVLTMLVSCAAFAQSLEENPVNLDVWSATHSGVLRGETVEWHSRFVSHTLVSPDRPPRLAFAAPLASGAVVSAVVGQGPALEVDERGQVIAVVFPTRSYGTYELRVTSPAEAGFEPPLVPEVPQRVELEGVRIRPGPDSPLELRLTDVRHRDVSSETADRLEEHWGEAQGASRPIVVLPDRAYFESGGLSAHVKRDEETRKRNFLGLSALVIVVLVALGILLGRVWRAAKAEEAEAFLREFDVKALDT